jgi:hypothetical protein
MPGYIKVALHKYQHPAPAHPEHAPHMWNPLIYCAKTQFVNEATPNPTLSNKDFNKLQQLTGMLLYYTRAVDPTLIMPINVLASEQSNAKEVTTEKVLKPAQLLQHSSRNKNTLPCIRHDIAHSQRRILSFRK